MPQDSPHCARSHARANQARSRTPRRLGTILIVVAPILAAPLPAFTTASDPDARPAAPAAAASAAAPDAPTRAPLETRRDTRRDVGPEVRRLLDLIEHRARLMPAVANWKKQRALPVTDPDRELQVLEQSSFAAAAAGLEPAGARTFVAAQMAVARTIQQAHHDAWGDRPPAATSIDLARDLRPAISATTRAILETLPRVLPLLRDSENVVATDLAARLAPLGASDASIRNLAASLAALRPAPPAGNRLERILAQGTLRVGTTGDYAPFSARAADGALVGIDIDLARSLGAALDVEVAFVTTSWPTLMADLQSEAFDIAMSGISRAPFRARVADFSDAYHVGGKTPIVRCEDREQFASLAAIDRPEVRAVVNPGGTNERFTRATLTQAPLSVFPDNTRIFSEIAEGRADVMFTDAIEVQLQTALDPRLCAALPGRTLTHQEKGFLLPRGGDGAWLRFVDLWLAQVRGDGTLQRIFDRHLLRGDEIPDPDPRKKQAARPDEGPGANASPQGQSLRRRGCRAAGGQPAARLPARVDPCAPAYPRPATAGCASGSGSRSPMAPSACGTGRSERNASSMVFTHSGSSCCTQCDACGR